jgi:glutamate-ammonia-ligase adenylyltransferase
MFDLQTHVQPEDRDELRKLGLRMGYADSPAKPALEAYEEDYRSRTEENRRILNHLLHDAFSDDTHTAAEVDLVLDPDPPPRRIAEVLEKYAFQNVHQAYRNLMALAEEDIRFLSTRRCRLFLASIAPQLLQAIAATPDPDSTLVSLDKVSSSLGGKGVLWELFSFNPPSLKLCVELCAYSPYLSEILITNPGMIDGLMDSLMLDKLPGRAAMRQSLAELCRAAEDLDPILHSFRNDLLLRVGVRDLLGKEDISATTRTLSEIAETCLAQIADHEYRKLARKFGLPSIEGGPGAGQPCEMAVLAMGKFGGQEMNYHSDLDIVFVYQADGHTKSSHPGQARESTTNQHFFSELGQRIIKKTSRLSAYGRLYEVDARLRPTGRSGALATSLDEFARYFAEGHGQLWERQALCKARVVAGSPPMAKAAAATVSRAAFEHSWTRKNADEIRRMRQRLEETVTGDNLKRGAGGIVDIEFLVQMLQLKFGRRQPGIRQPNTLAALEAIHNLGHLSSHDFQFFRSSYRFLRSLEGRLRLMSVTARDSLPKDPTELAKLAHLLDCPSGDAVLADFQEYTTETRKRFDRIFDSEGG